MFDHAILKRLKALIIFRAFFVTLIFGSFFVFNISYDRLPYPHALLYLIISFYLLTLIYASLINKVRNVRTFAYIQLSIDALAEIFLISLTGGIESWFSSLMLLTVMSSIIVLDKKAGYFIATLCGILYGLMIDLQFYRVVPIAYDTSIKDKDFLYNIFTHISALYLTAYLTGHLSSRLEKTSKSLKEKVSDLRDLTLFNRELIESLPSGLLTTDLSGKILVFNRASEHITGVSRAKAIGQHISNIFPFLSYPIETDRIDGRVAHASQTKTIGLTISGIIDSERSKTGYICIFQDITQLKNLEAELKYKETLAAIGEISANMAHEIRNPLASLKSSIELLKEGLLTSEYSEKLMNIAISEMDRLNKIITDFLTYSRPKAPEFCRFDLHKALDEVVELIKNAIVNTANITVKIDIRGQTEISGDPYKLRQVFLNLGMNAVDAMPDGGKLTIGTITGQKTVSIFFKDTGIGIPPENIKEIFYPFFTTKDKGTGLGLSIAYRIIEEHNGSIKVNSVPGHGTTFEVVIPLTQPLPSQSEETNWEGHVKAAL